MVGRERDPERRGRRGGWLAVALALALTLALGALFVPIAGGGAVTGWARPSSSFSGSALILNQLSFDALLVSGQRVGDAVLTAIQQSDPSTQRFLLESYTLLGDPAVRVY